MIKHNCCKNCLFEWKKIFMFNEEGDELICSVCGRTFKEIKLEVAEEIEA